MKRFIIISAVLIAFTSCGTGSSNKDKNNSTEISKQDVAKKINITQDTVVIQNWLKSVILDYLNGNDPRADFDKMRLALTDDYYNYKQESISLEYSDEMTEEEFHKKWKDKYDTKFVGGGGFFHPYQDHGEIDIPSCRFLKSLGDTAQIYRVVLHDLHWQSDQLIEVTIIKKDQKHQIDDVKYLIKKQTN